MRISVEDDRNRENIIPSNQDLLDVSNITLFVCKDPSSANNASRHPPHQPAATASSQADDVAHDGASNRNRSNRRNRYDTERPSARPATATPAVASHHDAI